MRNLTFDKYPEDAIGMEGVQEGGKITGSVERCWVHHNTFMPGFGNIGPDGKPAESDKAEGDGSCDFKRGQYFTCSYNYFTDCHKTNLVGSSDSSLQYDITYHHNWWHNCGSRIPLSRQEYSLLQQLRFHRHDGRKYKLRSLDKGKRIYFQRSKLLPRLQKHCGRQSQRLEQHLSRLLRQQSYG